MIQRNVKLSRHRGNPKLSMQRRNIKLSRHRGNTSFKGTEDTKKYKEQRTKRRGLS